MDSLKNAVGMGDNKETQPNQQSQGGGFLGGIGDKINSAAGGGKESEKNEDYLDKGIWNPNWVSRLAKGYWRSYRYQGVDMVQQYGMGQGDQSNESAVEQAKDEQISDFIRGQYKSKSGSDFPIPDKEKWVR